MIQWNHDTKFQIVFMCDFCLSGALNVLFPFSFIFVVCFASVHYIAHYINLLSWWVHTQTYARRCHDCIYISHSRFIYFDVCFLTKRLFCVSCFVCCIFWIWREKQNTQDESDIATADDVQTRICVWMPCAYY